MTKQEQIEEMAKIVDEMYNVYTTTADDIAEGLYNAGYRKVGEAEIERLKAENEELTKVVSSKVYDLIDNAKEIADAREAWEKQAKIEAVKEFAEKVKGEVYPFLQAEMYNKKHFITGDLISDKLLENQNIGILKAQDVLSKWFKVKIDELLKEYE